MKDQTNQESSLQKKLLSIRKELKCWESMFSRSRGRKPNKEDIELSGNEIKVAYKEYYHIKEKINHQEALKEKEDPSDHTHSVGTKKVDAVRNVVDDGVFGQNLNKSEMKTSKAASHLKNHCVGGKHKTLFAMKRHLKVPPKLPKVDPQNNLNEVSNVRVEEKQGDESERTKNMDAGERDDAINEKDIHENIKITSRIEDNYHYRRKSAVVSKKTGLSGRNFQLSKEWLDKLKPKNIVEREDEFEPFEEFDQNIEAEFMNFDVNGDKCSGETNALIKSNLDTVSDRADQSSYIVDEKFETSHSLANEERDDSVFGLKNDRLNSVQEFRVRESCSLVSENKPIEDYSCSKMEKFEASSIQNIEMSSSSGRILEKDRNSSLLVTNAEYDAKNEKMDIGRRETHDIQSNMPRLKQTDDSEKPWAIEMAGHRKRKTLGDAVQHGGATEVRNDEQEIVSKAKRLKREDTNVAIPKASKGKRLVSENFVKIDIQKKKYCRGKRRIKASTYKRQQWKKKTQFNAKSSAVCFKCGGEGHWAKECGKRSTKGNPGCRCGHCSLAFTYNKEELSCCSEIEKCKEALADELVLAEVMPGKPLQCITDHPGFSEVCLAKWSLRVAATKFKTRGHEKYYQRETEEKRFSSFDGKKNEDYAPVHESEDTPEYNQFLFQDIPDLPRVWPRIPYHAPRAGPPVAPLFQPDDGQPSQEAINEVNKALKFLGYSSFRQGQEDTVARIVSGLSTLLVLSTGSGKSLCYQLPAYLFYKKERCLTIVISPLVALMEDQVGNMPYGLKGACFHTNMTKAQREKVLQDIADRKIAILLLSPEALVSGSSSEGYIPMLGSLPPVAFACIDEAHCVSEWSHNFRPNYLRVCKVLRDYLGINCFLGLTATSTKATAISIAKHLGIEKSESEVAVIRGPTMPDNLHITVSKDQDRDQALVSLLSGERFTKCTSIIIYCTRREETERLASVLRTCLRNLPPTELDVDSEEEVMPKPKTKKKGKKAKPRLRSVAWDADCYHAGMTPAQRKRVQKKFMSGEQRIVVATTAFGMGLDKADVRAIIHYNMPKSFESFLQEIGRAGRDGLPAHCHIFLDEEAKDLCELRRHTYANSVDANSIKRLVSRVFKSCDCEERSQDGNKEHDKNSSKGGRHQVEILAQNRTCSVEESKEKNETDVANGHFQEDYIEKCFEDDFELDDIEGNENSESVNADVMELEAKFDKFLSSNEKPTYENPEFHLESEGLKPSQERAVPCDANAIPYTKGCHYYCSGHHVTFSIQQTIQALDMPEENIATFLSYLELLPDSHVTLLNPVKSSCTLQCYGGAKQMRLLATKFLPLTAVFNNMKRNHLKLIDSKAITFNAVEVADEMGWDLDPIYRELRGIQWNTSFSLNPNDSLVGKSGVLVEFSDPSFHVIAPGDLSNDERDCVCNVLLKMVKNQEETRLLQLDALYNILDQSSHSMYHDVVDKNDPKADKQLRVSIREYFECEPSEMKSLLQRLSPQKIEIPVPECKWNAISRDVRTMLGLHHDVMFNGRALARIFHGIDSPCFPAIVWGRDRRFWRRYLDVDFNDLRKFITEQIIRFRT